LRGSYLNNKKIGIWHEYENNKVKIKVAFDENEKFSGIYREFFPNGDIKEEKYYFQGEIKNLDNEIIWTKENINKEHMDIINEKNKKLEELKRKGREYLKYLDELEILRREGVNTPKREEELIKKIKEREEIGKKYAEYKRNLKKWIKSLKDKEIMNLLVN